MYDTNKSNKRIKVAEEVTLVKVKEAEDNLKEAITKLREKKD